MPNRFKDMTGKEFGCLVARWPAGRQGKCGATWWLCSCKCGTLKTIRGETLRRGVSKSCGCNRRSFRAETDRKAGRNVRSDFSKVQYLLWAGAKHRASKKSLSFTISPSDILIPNKCPLLGIRLNLKPSNKRTWNSPSLDRLDSTKGYDRDNILVVSWRANDLKADATLEELKSIVFAWESLCRT
jgi:hypothetical protein